MPCFYAYGSGPGMATIDGSRVYRDDRQAIKAAKRLLKSRAADANGEVWLYRGTTDDRDFYMGKAAYNPLGTAVTWVPADADGRG